MSTEENIHKVEKVISLLDKRITKLLLEDDIDDGKVDTLTDIRTDYNEELEGLKRTLRIRKEYGNYKT